MPGEWRTRRLTHPQQAGCIAAGLSATVCGRCAGQSHNVTTEDCAELAQAACLLCLNAGPHPLSDSDVYIQVMVWPVARLHPWDAFVIRCSKRVQAALLPSRHAGMALSLTYGHWSTLWGCLGSRLSFLDCPLGQHEGVSCCQ